MEAIDKNNKKFVACINSYLGMVSHFKSYKLRRKMLLECLSPELKNLICINNKFSKVSLKKGQRTIAKQPIQNNTKTPD